jgi:apolipoprotein D and lipocalin family protein
MARLIGCLLAVALLSATGCYTEPPLDVAPNVTLAQFSGRWYEIARLPRATQSGCTGTVASYELDSAGSLDITSECRLGRLDGPRKVMRANAKVPDASIPAKLALEVGGFYGDYWILEVGSAYEFAVVGHPSREYLWILSRTPKLDPGKLHAIVERAQANHFEVSRLEYTLQPDR